MPYYAEQVLSNRPYQFEFDDDYNQELGNLKSAEAKRRAAAQRAAAQQAANKKAAAQRAANKKAADKRAADKRAADQRAAADRRAATRKPPTLKVRKTKNLYSLTPDDLSSSQTIFRVENGRGAEVGQGISTPYNPFSINNLPPAPRISVVSSTAKSSKVDSIFGLMSQVISGWSKNPTVQTADGQAPIYNMPANQQTTLQPNSGYQSGVDNPGGAGANVGASLGSGFDGIISWAAANPLIVVGFAGAAYLLFKQPPKYGSR